MRRGAFTLIELLIAIAIGMALIAMAWTAFVRTKEATARAMARVDLHRSAGNLRHYLNRDFSTLGPAIAFFVRSQPGVVAGSDRSDTLEVVAMRSTAPLRSQFSDGEWSQRVAEHFWVRWRFVRIQRQVGGEWQTASHLLYRAESSPTRRWKAENTLVATSNPYNYNDQWFFNIPRALRDARGGIPSLENNRYNTPVAMIDKESPQSDYGDLTDLDLDEKVVSTRVRDLMVGWMDAGGGQTVVTSTAAADHKLDGLWLDGVGPGANQLAQLKARPRVLRFSLNLADGGGLSQDFSFSVAAPGLAPPPGN